MSTPAPPEWTFEQLQARLQRPAFNAWLGLQLIDWNESGVTLGFAARPELYGHAAVPSLHGGILATLIDVAASLAVIVRAGGSLYTVDMRVDYHRPATAPGYRVRSEVVRIGRTLATSDARVLTTDGTLIASGRGVYHHFPIERS